jgi:RNA polymerase sigma-70 factor (ECF subfamily)
MTTQRFLMSVFTPLHVSASEADWEALYTTEMPRVYNFFRYRVGDDQLAEDLSSATFEKAWRGRVRYQRDLAAFSTWLFTIARNVAIDYYRQRRVELTLEDVRLEDVRLQADEHTPDAEVESKAEFAQLSALLARLPERERELLAMKYGAGLTNREIASVTGLSESNVGTILYRTVHGLRAEWKE